MRKHVSSWPPVASHIACLLIGFAIPHLEVLDFRYDVLPLDTVFITRPAPPRDGKPLVMIKPDKKRPCKWSDALWRSYQVGPTFLVGTKVEALKTMFGARRKELQFTSISKAASYPPCLLEPLVTYEQR